MYPECALKCLHYPKTIKKKMVIIGPRRVTTIYPEWETTARQTRVEISGGE